MKNGTESDIDCGGTCGTCDASLTCGHDGDCASGTCANGSCVGSVAVFTERTIPGQSPPALIGTIPSHPGRVIRILKIGICGDADATSGPQGFRAFGSGVDLTWAAGQNTNGGAQHYLTPTPNLGNPSRGFSYKTVDVASQPGASLQVDFQYQFDFDGLYCDATDEDGVSYNDNTASTTRAWIKYRYE